MIRDIVVLFLLAGLGVSCEPAAPMTAMKIAVIGNAVPADTLAPNRWLNVDSEKGSAIYYAAKLAIDSSPQLKNMPYPIHIVGYDDGGIPNRAESLAKQIAIDPSVIAVIGHTTSATTRAAGGIYESVGLPLLMPIATSRFAATTPANLGERRLRTAFRLLPGDDLAQAPAIVFTAVNKLHAHRVFILRDSSAGSVEYSAPLAEQVEKLFGTLSTRSGAYSPNAASASSVVFNVRSQRPDVIVFCGYANSAQPLLAALREAYQRTPSNKRPRIILSDGAFDPKVDPTGFETYVTFPIESLQHYSDSSKSPDITLLKALVTSRGKESYEMFAYDGVLLLAHAIRACEKAASRSCVVAALRDVGDNDGAAVRYNLKNGENSRAEYFVYRAESDSLGSDARFKKVWGIREADLQGILK